MSPPWGGAREVRGQFACGRRPHRELGRDYLDHAGMHPAPMFGGAIGCSNHRFHALPAYTALLVTLHPHRATNQYRTRLIKSSRLWGLAAALKHHLYVQFPIQVLTELNVAWLQWSYENWYFQVDKPLRQINSFIVVVVVAFRNHVVLAINY